MIKSKWRNPNSLSYVKKFFVDALPKMVQKTKRTDAGSSEVVARVNIRIQMRNHVSIRIQMRNHVMEIKCSYLKHATDHEYRLCHMMTNQVNKLSSKKACKI